MEPTPRTAVIIGSGFGGQVAAINLLRRGIDDFVILERRETPGGTWCQNSYPGAAVDVPSPLYSVNGEPYPWSQLYADQAELRRYTEYLLRRYRLADRTITGAEVVSAEWEDGAWRVATRDRGEFAGRFLINASGPLSNPKIPDLPGMADFTGDSFHTNAWDHSVDYRGKRLAVVGTGASAAQVIPALQPDVAELHVFQREPHWVLPRPDRPFTPRQRRMLARNPAYRAVRTGIYWQLEARVIGFKYSDRVLREVAQKRALRLLREQVPDTDLRARLTPDYTIGCKRILLSSTLYPALAADNSTLHDGADGIERLTPGGVITSSGSQVDLDIIVWATGFQATDGLIPYPIVGRGGRTLQEFWTPFPRAYLGTTAPGFPNLFVVTGPNTGIGHTSALFIIEAQMEYIMRAIEAARSRGGQVEVTARAEDDYTTTIHREMQRTVWARGGCNSWYQSASGHVIAMYPGFSFSYRRAARHFRPDDHAFA